MSGGKDPPVLSRIAGAARRVTEERTHSPARALRQALIKAADETLGLTAAVRGAEEARRGREAALSGLGPGSLYLLLSDPDGAFGLAVLDPGLVSAIVEMRTIGRIAETTDSDRTPTRTDAALAAQMLDATLDAFEAGLDRVRNSEWAKNYRQVDFVEKPKSAGLILEDVGFRLIDIRLDLDGGAREGRFTLILPADRQRPGDTVSKVAEAAVAWQSKLQDTVSSTPVPLTAVLWRFRYPLSELNGFAAGDLIPVPMTSVGQVALEGIGAERVAVGRLGQSDGRKAVRIDVGQEGTDPAPATAAAPPAVLQANPDEAPPQADTTPTLEID